MLTGLVDTHCHLYDTRGVPVELVLFEGEGHGFRDPVNQLDEYRRLEEFLSAHCR